MTRQQWRMRFEYEQEENPYGVTLNNGKISDCSKCSYSSYEECKLYCDIIAHNNTDLTQNKRKVV